METLKHSPSPVCLGDTVLVADVGNSRIKLGLVVDYGNGTTPVTLPRDQPVL